MDFIYEMMAAFAFWMWIGAIIAALWDWWKQRKEAKEAEE